MEILNATEACLVVDDDLLDFSLETEDGENSKTIFKGASAASSSSSSCLTTAAAAAAVFVGLETRSGSYPVFVEEELEWLSNKEAFPSVETCFGILSDNPELMSSHQSPVSVLESSSSNGNAVGVASAVADFCCGLKLSGSVPVRPRSKRQRRKRTASFGELRNHKQLWWLKQVNVKNKQESSILSSPISTTMTSGDGARMGRRCLHCRAERTPQWRAGPMGPKTLCNACGVRYKSGRLLPEYRPANSPTFSGTLHSNSHRKVVEMRRQKQLALSSSNGRWNHG